MIFHSFVSLLEGKILPMINVSFDGRLWHLTVVDLWLSRDILKEMCWNISNYILQYSMASCW